MATLGKSKETVLELWGNLQVSQVIATIPTTNSFVIRGIEFELQEIKNCNETYPLTLVTCSTSALAANWRRSDTIAELVFN